MYRRGPQLSGVAGLCFFCVFVGSVRVWGAGSAPGIAPARCEPRADPEPHTGEEPHAHGGRCSPLRCRARERSRGGEDRGHTLTARRSLGTSLPTRILSAKPPCSPSRSAAPAPHTDGSAWGATGAGEHLAGATPGEAPAAPKWLARSRRVLRAFVAHRPEWKPEASRHAVRATRAAPPPAGRRASATPARPPAQPHERHAA